MAGVAALGCGGYLLILQFLLLVLGETHGFLNDIHIVTKGGSSGSCTLQLVPSEV